MRSVVFGLGAIALSTIAVSAQEAVTVPFDGDVGDAAFAVESAIVNRGWSSISSAMSAR